MTLRKALVAITVVAMLLSMASTALAGGFTDITDSKVAAAAARLGALSIMQGFPDGSFGPSATITRAQFAAVAVRALGLDSAATYARGFTRFADVGASHWASGYVNIAAQQGIITGFPDNTFHPEEPVTYAQALTIITRMLGYGPVTEGRGTWPSNYIVRAAMIGFTKGVSFSAMAPATRGSVAVFVDNSLTADLMINTGAIGSTATWEIVEGRNLLNTYLGATKVEGTLTSSPDLLGVSTVAVEGGDALALANGVSAAGLLGHEVSVWIRGGEVVLIEDEAVGSVHGTVDAYVPGETITIDGDVYHIAAGVFLARNGVKHGAPAAGNEAEVVLNDDDEAVAIILFDFTIATVDEVDADGELVYTDVTTLDFGAGASSVTLNGKPAAFTALKAGDILQYYGAVNGDKVVIATRVHKTGWVSRVKADGTIVIGGVTYGLLDYAGVADATSLAGEDVEFSLDKNGDIAAIQAASADAAGGVYAVVTTDAWRVPTIEGINYYFKVLRADGTKASLKFADEVSFNGAPAISPFEALFGGVGTFITYTLDSTGAVDAVDVITGVPVDLVQSAANKLANNLLVTASTVIVDLSDPTDPAFLSSNAFFNLDVTSGFVKADSTVPRRAAYVVVLGYSGITESPLAYVTDVYYADGSWRIVTLDGDIYRAAVSVADHIYLDTVYSLAVTGDEITAAIAQPDINHAVPTWDHNVVIAYDSIENLLTYKLVTAANVKIGVNAYALFNHDTVFVDARGDIAKAGTEALLTAGKTVNLYDFNADAIADMVVVR